MHVKCCLSAAFILSLWSGAAAAESIPLPSVDYEVTAKVFGGATMSSRHAAGKVRAEVQAPGMPGAMVSIIDLKAKRMVGLMSLPGQPPMAMEIELGNDPGMGVAVGEGKRSGTGNVAGEACDLWSVEPSDPDDKEFAGVVCITKDGIPLSMEGTIDGKREKIFEVTSVKRGPQDPKLFVVPANAQKMQLPKDMMKGKK